MDIANEIEGTPIEEWRDKAEVFRQFLDTPGYKQLSNFVLDKQAELMRVFLDGDENVDLKQLRADFKAYHNLLLHVNDTVKGYDTWLEMTSRQMEIQTMKAMEGMNNG